MNAEEAKTIALEIQSKNSDIEYPLLIMRIKKAAELGKRQLIIEGRISVENSDKLHKLGYSILISNNRENSWTHDMEQTKYRTYISW